MQTKAWFLNFSVFILKIFAYSKALDVTQYGAFGDGVTDDSQVKHRFVVVMLIKIFVHYILKYHSVKNLVFFSWKAFLKAWEAVCSGTGDGQLIVPAGMSFMLQPLKFQGSCKPTPIAVQVLCLSPVFSILLSLTLITNLLI